MAFKVYRVSVAQDWAKFRVHIRVDWAVFRVQTYAWAVFRVQTRTSWFRFRCRIIGSVVFRVSVALDETLQKLKVFLYPLDDAVLIQFPEKEENLKIIVYSLRNNNTILHAEYPDEVPSWLFRSQQDGVYRVLVQQHERTVADQYVVVNNKTLFYLENLRREELDACEVENYKLVLALNYTALDNWRIGAYENANAIYQWIHEHQLVN